MKTKTSILVAVVLATAFGTTAAVADTKKVIKGRSGMTIVQVKPKQKDVQATNQRPTTVGLMVEEKPKRKVIRKGGRGAR